MQIGPDFCKNKKKFFFRYRIGSKESTDCAQKVKSSPLFNFVRESGLVWSVSYSNHDVWQLVNYYVMRID